MPSSNPALPFVKQTNENFKSNILDASVIANYGDPGLDEDYFADILSRFVICMIESSNRVLTYNRWQAGMIVMVQRPQNLWINYQGGFVNNPSSQARVDYNLNANFGAAGSYSANSIPRINNPYQLGEKIKIKLTSPQNLSVSACPSSVSSSAFNYGPWHTQGASAISYNVAAALASLGVSDVLSALKIKPLRTTSDSYTYDFGINKLQYEAFAMMLYNSTALIRLFAGVSNDAYYYSGNGGYYFKPGVALSQNINYVHYEDINAAGKARVPSNTCVPLVVTTPSTFTVPQTRAVGTVAYSPTYIPRS